MKKYTVIYQDVPDWDKVPAVELGETGWLEPCGIQAQAQACHDGENLWVRMEAEEKVVRATLTGKLDQVCDDSCLEFFFAPLPEDDRYFNFEWNPLGTLYLGFGGARPTRVRQITKKPEELFAPQPFRTEQGWGIIFKIPASYIGLYIPGYRLEGEAACNFYKCGDQTEKVHYLAWSPLSSSAPDYHRRQDFGAVCFEKPGKIG